jgi:hypothetical protein
MYNVRLHSSVHALMHGIDEIIRPYSKSSLTLNEWRLNPSFSRVSMLFWNSWRVSSHIVRYDTSPPAIQKQHWHSREAQIQPPLIECEWAFRIRALISVIRPFSNVALGTELNILEIICIIGSVNKKTDVWTKPCMLFTPFKSRFKFMAVGMQYSWLMTVPIVPRILFYF